MKIKVSKFMINEQIQDEEVRVINMNGDQLGVMPAKDALNMAKKEGIDLVKISPNAKPPVCKIVNYGKFKYELEKKEKEKKRKQKTIEIKEIQLSPNIDTNDLKTKLNHAKKFLKKGNKVKVVLRFRGREIKHIEQSIHVLEDFVESLSDVALIEKTAKIEGKNLSMVLSSKKSN